MLCSSIIDLQSSVTRLSLSFRTKWFFKSLFKSVKRGNNRPPFVHWENTTTISIATQGLLFFSIPKYFVIVITAELPNEVQIRVIKIIRLHWSFIVYSNRTNRYENPLGVVCQSMIPVLFIMWMPRKGNVIHVFNIIQKCIYSVASIANYILKIY